MVHNGESRASAGRHIETVTRENLHVLGNHFGVVHVRLDKRRTRNQAVNIFFGDPGIFQCEFGTFHVELGGTKMWDYSDFSVGGPNNRHFAAERVHTRLPPLLESAAALPGAAGVSYLLSEEKAKGRLTSAQALFSAAV